jgi:AraC-like DNA-binding protein
MAFEQQELVLRPGQLYLIPAHGARRYRCRKRMSLYWSHFSIRLHSGPDIFDTLGRMLVLGSHDATETERLFRQLASGFKANTPDNVVARSGILMQLVAPFLESVDALQLEGRRSAMQRFARAFETIEAHLGESISVPSLAAVAGMSPSHFARRFSGALGISPGRYIMRRRIEEARIRLAESDDTLDAVAADLGFCDGFHFSKVFKKETGLSPSAFRKTLHGP